jgi:O-antigen/teichoic acid export membrane protein
MDRRRFINGTLLVLTGMVFGKLVSLAIRMIVARLGVEESGIFYLSMYILKLAALISFLGFEAFLVRDVSEALARKKPGLAKSIVKSSLRILLPFSFLIAGILFFSAAHIAAWFHEPRLFYPIIIIACYFGKDSLRLVFAVIAFVSAGTVTAILFSNLVAFIVLSLGAIMFLRSFLFRNPAGRSKASIDWRSVFSFTLPIYGGALTFASLEWIDSFMIGRMLSVADVGIYDAAFSLAWCLLLLPSATMTFLLPKIIGIQKKRRLLQAYYRRIAAWNLALNGLFAGIFILFGNVLLQILFGKEFTGGYVFLVVLSIGFWIAHSLLVSRAFLYINRKGTVLFVIALSAAILSIVLNYFLITSFGTLGAAIATSISAIYITAAYMIATHNDLRLLPFSAKLLAPTAGFLLVLVGSACIRDTPFTLRLMLSAMLVLLYFGVHLTFSYWRKELWNVFKVVKGWSFLRKAS